MISKSVAVFFAENPEQLFTAIKFRGRVYVASPRHQDAINLAFAGMTKIGCDRIVSRIAEGRETLRFGSARGDGSEWVDEAKYHSARMQIYGFSV